MIYYYHHHTYTIEIIESENNITNISLLTHKSKKQNGVTIIEVPSSIKQTINWFDKYFSHKPLPATPPLSPSGTQFQMLVWNILQNVQYGELVSYKYIGIKVANKLGKKNISYQAIGQAISKNPIAIIIPCHRVIKSNGKIGGYYWGTNIKEELIKHESIKNVLV